MTHTDHITRHRGPTRFLLLALGLTQLTLGLYALLDSSGFYNDFPLGRGWVAADGPYNQHLVRDVGALNLALALVTIMAAVLLTRHLIQAASGARPERAMLGGHARHPRRAVLPSRGLLLGTGPGGTLALDVPVPPVRAVPSHDGNPSTGTEHAASPSGVWSRLRSNRANLISHTSNRPI